MTKTTWTKDTINVAMPRSKTTHVPGFVRGVWGVHRTVGYSGWSVTHIPCGLAVRNCIRRKALAIEFVDTIADNDPKLMHEQDEWVLKKLYPEFKNYFEEATQREQAAKKAREEKKKNELPLVSMGTNKWARAAFIVYERNILDSKLEETKVSGYVKGVWGVYKNVNWNVVYLPSKQHLASSLQLKKAATLIVDIIAKEKPEFLYHKDVMSEPGARDFLLRVRGDV